MSESTNRVNNGYYDDEEEISIPELFGYVFNHFKMIVIITLVVSLIGVCFALLTPKVYEVSATLKIQAPYGAGTVQKYSNNPFSSTIIMNDVFLRSNIENAIKNTPSEKEVDLLYEDVIEDLSYWAVDGTYNWIITLEKTSDTEYWIQFIENMVAPVMAEVPETFSKDAETARGEIQKRIAQYEELKSVVSSSTTASSSDDTDLRSYQATITSLNEELRIVDQFELYLPTAVEWVLTPRSGEKSVGMSRAVMCVIFFLAGGVVSVIIALVLGFTDKRVYNSTKLRETVDDRLVASIPLYKKNSEIDEREFRYIAEKINLKKDDTLSVVTLSEKAGGKTISSRLEKECEAEVVNLGLLVEKPDVISGIRESSYTLVVLRAGVDNYTVLEKFISDMAAIEVTSYGFVLNGVDKSDKDVTLYSEKESYTSHKWLRETWKSYYTKNL